MGDEKASRRKHDQLHAKVMEPVSKNDRLKQTVKLNMQYDSFETKRVEMLFKSKEQELQNQIDHWKLKCTNMQKNQIRLEEHIKELKTYSKNTKDNAKRMKKQNEKFRVRKA